MSCKDYRAFRRLMTAAICISAFLPVALHAQAPTKMIPVSAEPHHHLRLENKKVRIYEVVLPKGESTLWHEHSEDNFAVFINASSVIVQSPGLQPMSFPIAAGGVSFRSTANGPYSHRVEGNGDTPFRVMLLELRAPQSGTSASGTPQRADPPFYLRLQNSRGRVYRVILGPGQSTGMFTRPANTAIFAISSGRISEQAKGKAAKTWEFDAGAFRWADSAESLSLKNEGASKVDLVEIEVY